MKGSGIKSQELANAGAAQGISRTAAGNSSSLYGTLDPTLSTMATAPQGINPTDMAKMKTEAMQSAGGANAGAVGQGSLLSARTRNAGTADAAIAKSGENAMKTLSDANLGIENENQQVKQGQQAQGLKGLEDLYGVNSGEAVGALNSSNSALKNAGDIVPFWQKWLLNAQDNAGKVASAYMGGG